MSTLSFKIQLKEVAVEINDRPYKLVELTGAQRDTFLNDGASRMRFDNAGKPVGIKNFDGFQTKLVSLSLRDPEGKAVPEAEIKTWPASMVEALFKEAQNLSGIGEGLKAAEEAAKNG